MSKLVNYGVEFHCAKCEKPIAMFTPHIAVRFTFLTGDVAMEWRHFCTECCVDPACAVLFSDVLLQPLKAVLIRKWWA